MKWVVRRLCCEKISCTQMFAPGIISEGDTLHWLHWCSGFINPDIFLRSWHLILVHVFCPNITYSFINRFYFCVFHVFINHDHFNCSSEVLQSILNFVASQKKAHKTSLYSSCFKSLKTALNADTAQFSVKTCPLFNSSCNLRTDGN